jgi:DNA-binding IclR family transcriptional regulator
VNRFELLQMLDRTKPWMSIREIQIFAGCRESVRTQLGRMHRWGLVRRRQDRFAYRKHHGFGIWVFRISKRGRERLAWARSEGKI